MNELQDTLEEIMEIFKCQDNMLDILEDQQHQLEQLKSVNLKQQELLEKLNAENRRLSAENRNLIVQNQKLAAQNKQLQELCRE